MNTLGLNLSSIILSDSTSIILNRFPIANNLSDIRFFVLQLDQDRNIIDKYATLDKFKNGINAERTIMSVNSIAERLNISFNELNMQTKRLAIGLYNNTKFPLMDCEDSVLSFFNNEKSEFIYAYNLTDLFDAKSYIIHIGDFILTHKNNWNYLSVLENTPFKDINEFSSHKPKNF